MSFLRSYRRAQPRTTDGVRIYAIGDVHGCFDLLIELLQKIEKDGAERPLAETHIVLLGDYVDRGTSSAEVCRLLHSMRESPRFHCLKGNHEQAMVDVINGSRSSLRFWLQYGGGDTAESWGIDPWLVEQARSMEQAETELMLALRAAVPRDVIEWLEYLPKSHRVGDYLFVHAGIRPKVPIESQSEFDLMWIREPFLSSRTRHPHVIVHGHSEDDKPQVRFNRIGIDTGAYRTGVLTAIGIEDNDHWFLQTGRG